LLHARSHDLAQRSPTDDTARTYVTDDFEHLRWFELPAICLEPL
jgi:hypothetical protein